jgi:hypothetical protein
MLAVYHKFSLVERSPRRLLNALEAPLRRLSLRFGYAFAIVLRAERSTKVL